MAIWTDVEAAAPELAATARQRFEAHGLALLATLRRDGSPRISGIEPLFALGELWLGMMPGSRKAADLQRDPRFALHNATVDKEVKDGDAKISGAAVVVDDEADFARFLKAFKAATGYAPGPPGSFVLFKADVREVSMVKPAGDHLDIESWREGRGLRKVERK
jgi:Pyridoxamine 5'-phosphate oxidase